MANGGNGHSTGFAKGEIVTAVDKAGHIAAALAATEAGVNNYTTKDLHFSIGGVGVSGFNFYGQQSKVLIPPIQPSSKLTEKLILPESAFVVVVALGGGQNTIVLQGIPGFVLDANGTGPGWSGVMIGHTQLKSGTYAVIEKTTNHDAGSPDRADVVGIFAFANSAAGFIDKILPIRVVATVPVASSPGGVAYDRGKGEIFVLGSNNMSVISDATNKVVGTVAVAGGSGLAYDSAKGEVFVAVPATSSLYNGNVSVISDATNKVVATVTVGIAPISVVYDNGKGEIFVANQGYCDEGASVSVISDATNSVVATLPMGGGSCPEGLAYDSGKGEIFVANSGEGEVMDVISDATNTFVAGIFTGGYSIAVAYDKGKGELFVTLATPDNGPVVEVISDATNAIVANIAIYGLGVAYDNPNGEVFVSSFTGGGSLSTVSVISDTTNTVVATIPVGSYSYEIAYDREKGELFVPGPGSTVTVISGNVTPF